MDPRRWRVLIAAALVATSAAAGCSRPTAPPVGQAVDAQVSDVGASADATAGASTDASATAEASADASADATAEATADASVDAGAAGAARARTVRIDEGSEGKVIDLAPGQSLVLMLAANPTTGFDWAVLKAPAALGAPDLGFVGGGEQPGAPGKRRITWTLKNALPAGDQPVELGYARGFEKGVAPFKTFRFKVRAAH
jgi:predicted secreted protein